jgi:hypothetical protein
MSASSSIPLIAAAVSTSASSSFFQAAGRSATAFSKPSIQSSQKDIAVAGVDGEQRAIAVGALHQCARDVVVALHDETENTVGMVKVFGRWPVGCIIPRTGPIAPAL